VRAGDDLDHLARAERSDLLALLIDLAPHQCDEPTLCTGWRVRDVVAHMIRYERLVRAGVAKLGQPDVVDPPGIEPPLRESAEQPSPAEPICRTL
jgi:uncharacterized protein (TIGR03083 family)